MSLGFGLCCCEPDNPCDLPPFENFELTQEIGQIFPAVNTSIEYEMSLPPQLINSNGSLSFVRRVTRAGDIVAAASAGFGIASSSSILLDHQNTPPLFGWSLIGDNANNSANPLNFRLSAGGFQNDNNQPFEVGDEFGFRIRDVQTVDGGNVNLQGGEVTATLERFYNDQVLFTTEIELARCFSRVIFQLTSSDDAGVFPLAEDIIIRIEYTAGRFTLQLVHV